VKQTDLKRRLAEADTRISRANLQIRKQRGLLSELRSAGMNSEAAQAQAMLEVLEDGLRRIIGERNFLIRSFGLADAVEETPSLPDIELNTRHGAERGA
jgi:hypothetical protein